MHPSSLIYGKQFLFCFIVKRMPSVSQKFIHNVSSKDEDNIFYISFINLVGTEQGLTAETSLAIKVCSVDLAHY